jgi:hypothetical protein
MKQWPCVGCRSLWPEISWPCRTLRGIGRHHIFRCDVCDSVKCSPKPGATGQSWSLTEGLLICRKCKKSPSTTPFGQEEEEAVDGVPFVVNSFIANSPSFGLCMNRMGLKFPQTVPEILQEYKEAALLSPKLHCPWKHHRDRDLCGLGSTLSNNCTIDTLSKSHEEREGEGEWRDLKGSSIGQRRK